MGDVAGWLKAGLVLVTKDALDLKHQIAQVKGLGQDLGQRRLPAGAQGDGGKAGNEDHLGFRRNFGAALGQFDAIHFRHDDIGQQQIEMLALQKGQGGGATVNRHHLIAGVFKRPGKVGAHGFFVFGKQNADHRLMAPLQWIGLLIGGWTLTIFPYSPIGPVWCRVFKPRVQNRRAFDSGAIPRQPALMGWHWAKHGDSQAVAGGRIPRFGGAFAFHLCAPKPSAIPVLIAVPHAGRAYPQWLLDHMRLPALAALRLEDRLVDQLAKEVARQTGAALLVARAPRAMIDLNRCEDDVDWEMFADSPPDAGSQPPGGRARSGLGLIPRRLPGIGELWKGRHAHADLAARIAGIHAPYHHCLAETLEALRAESPGIAWTVLHDRLLVGRILASPLELKPMMTRAWSFLRPHVVGKPAVAPRLWAT